MTYHRVKDDKNKVHNSMISHKNSYSPVDSDEKIRLYQHIYTALDSQIA